MKDGIFNCFSIYYNKNYGLIIQFNVKLTVLRNIMLIIIPQREKSFRWSKQHTHHNSIALFLCLQLYLK